MKIENEIPQALDKKIEDEMKTETENLEKLFVALAQAQSEMEVAELNCKNPFFKSKYADFASIVKASRPALTKNGIMVSQKITTNKEGFSYVQTKMGHSSGQWMESNIRIVPPKNDIHTFGSYISYLKRYCYAALVGVIVAEEDDDGEKAMPEKEGRTMEKISPEQLQTLSAELEPCEDVIDQIKVSMKIKNLSEMPQNMFQPALKRIRQIKQERALHA